MRVSQLFSSRLIWRGCASVQVYLWTGSGRFKVMDRKEVERQAVAIRLTALDGGKRAGVIRQCSSTGVLFTAVITIVTIKRCSCQKTQKCIQVLAQTEVTD
jgi:hypothetical protein